MLYLGYFSISFEKKYFLNQDFDIKSCIVDLFTLEKKQNKATFHVTV